MARKDVIEQVCAERDRQDGRWGEQNHDPLFYFAILAEEVGEAAKEVVEMRSLLGRPTARGLRTYQERGALLRSELIQVAAVAVAMVECLDRSEWVWGK